jgi:lysophospholipase L1-like esterase
MPKRAIDFTAYLPGTSPIPSSPSLDPWAVSGAWALAADAGGKTALQCAEAGINKRLLLPSHEKLLNARIVFDIDNGSLPGLWHRAILRWMDDGKFYCVGIWSGFATIDYCTDGTNFGSLLLESFGVAVDYSHTIRVTCDIRQDGTDVDLSVTFLNLTTAATATKSVTDPNRSGLQGPGRLGLMSTIQSDPGLFSIHNFKCFNLDEVDASLEPAASFTLNVSTTVASTDTVAIVATGTNTNWARNTLFTISGGSANIVSVAVNSPTSTTFLVRPGLSAATVTIAQHDGPSSTFSVTGTATGLMAGLIEATAVSPTAVSWSATAALGGTGPYTYIIQRDTNPNFTSPTTVGTTLTGTDTGPFTAGTIYYYRILATDSAGSPATATGLAKIRTGFGFPANQVLPVVIPYPAIGVISIGDSITNGMVSGLSPVVRASYHMNKGARVFTFLNRGIVSSTTTLWRSDNGSNYLDNAIAAGDALATAEKWATIMLGANDVAIEGLSVATYTTNMTEIANFLVAAGYKVLLIPPPIALDPSAGANLAEKLTGYGAALADLADDQDIFVADNKTRDEFVIRPAGLIDGVHPGEEGSNAVGECIGGEFDRIFYAVDVVPPTGGVPLIGGGLVR